MMELMNYLINDDCRHFRFRFIDSFMHLNDAVCTVRHMLLGVCAPRNAPKEVCECIGPPWDFATLALQPLGTRSLVTRLRQT